MAIAGIDIGTTGSKCCVYREDGTLLSEAFAEYRGKAEGGAYELDVKKLWAGVVSSVREAAAKAPDIRAVAVTSFGESFTLLDEQDCPMTPFMLYSDSRGYEESLELQHKFGAKEFGRIAGIRPSQMMSVSKLLWIRKHQPSLFARAKRILSGADYVVYRLCNACMTDYTLAARTAMFDVHSMEWNEKILDFAGIAREQLPQACPTGSIAGTILPRMAEELGLLPDVKILVGCHDQAASAVGTGILKPGMAVDSMGTLECITSFYEGCPEYLALYRGSYAIVPYMLSGAYVTYAFSLTGGALLRWCKEQLGKQELLDAKSRGESFYSYMDARVSDKPTNLLVLPHFTGAGTPYMDSESRGAVIGLSTGTTLEEIYRAMMEGSSFEMRYNLERLLEGGIKVRELRATGGGSQSARWLQIKADILGIPITSQGDYRAAALGCAMLASVALGGHGNLIQAAETFVKPGNTYEPRESMSRQYDQIFERYRHLYQAVKTVL